MARKPADRFNSAGELASALDRWLASATQEAGVERSHDFVPRPHVSTKSPENLKIASVPATRP